MKKALVLCILPSLTLCYNQHHLTKLQQALSSKNSKINASHCDLRGLGSALQGANFSKSQLSGALFDKISASPNPVFAGLVEIAGQNSDLSGANFSNASLVSTSFKDANLQGADFSGADISYADFSNADLTGAKLSGAKNHSLALFSGATMPDGTVHA
jgi:uncharacterized protein YjbI with pentapeptide repeats